MLALWKNVTRGTTPITAVPASWLLNQDRLPCDWLLTMVSQQETPKPLTEYSQLGKHPGAYCQIPVQDQNGQTQWFLAG